MSVSWIAPPEQRIGVKISYEQLIMKGLRLGADFIRRMVNDQMSKIMVVMFFNISGF